MKKVDQVRPKICLIENVKGLLSDNSGKTLTKVLQEIQSVGYKTFHKVLNANDFGVPQKRCRLFIVGIRHDIYHKDFEFPEPLGGCKPVLRDVLVGCPQSEGTKYPQSKIDLFEMIPQGGCWTSLPEHLQKSYLCKSFESGGGKRGILRRLSMDEPCLTLLTTPSQKQTERCHPLETRPLQILESARIQTFPDDYMFCGSLAQKYRQIGNAVPVNLAREIAKEIKKYLNPE